MLHNVTITINFVALMIALWLGLYLVTRSPRRQETWLSALALWSMSGYFLNQLLALHPPPTPPQEIREWLYHLMLFWPRDVFELGWKGWLQGWLPAYSIFFWHHATLYMLPGHFNRGRWVRALSGYVVALAGILIKAVYSSAWVNLAGNPLYLTTLKGPLLPLFSIGFVMIAAPSVFNLTRARRSAQAPMPPEQFRLFIYAMLVGGAAGISGALSGLLDMPLPQVIPALFLSATLILTGAGLARYNAFLDRKPLQRDFLSSAAQAGAILLIYMIFLWVLKGVSMLPAITFVGVGCLAVVSHFLIEVARLRVDRKFFQNKNRRLPNLAEEPESSQVWEDPPPVALEQDIQAEEISSRLVELALRNIHNHAYLADSPLVKLRLVGRCTESLDNGTKTHIDRGRALSDVLSEAVYQLRPAQQEPRNSYPRSWYPYLILRDAYLEDQPNREIMSRLYISEGTFNRTRRAAISSVARILEEMEASFDRG